MTDVRFKRPARPTEAQWRLLELVHERLRHRYACTPLKLNPILENPHEEELLGEVASFKVEAGAFELDVRTPLPWNDQPEERVTVGFAPYRGATQAAPWALVRDREARAALARLGFSEGSWCEVSFPLGTAAAAAQVEAMVGVVTSLGSLEVRTVRPGSLLAGERFPSTAALLVVEADRIVSLASDEAICRLVVERDDQEIRVGISPAELPWVERLRGQALRPAASKPTSG